MCSASAIRSPARSSSTCGRDLGVVNSGPVGDAIRDIRSAKGAGVRAIAVLNGGALLESDLSG